MRTGAVSVLLRIRDSKAARISGDLAEIYNPRSPKYGRFVDPSRFQNRYGPSRAEVKAVRSRLRDLGLKSSWSVGSPFVTASGPVSAIDRVFGVAVHRFAMGSSTRFIQGTRPSRVPPTIRSMVRSILRPSTMPVTPAAIPSNGLTPVDTLKAYDISPLAKLGMNGRGQTVVFVEVDDINNAALAAFADRFHLPPFRYTLHGPKIGSQVGEATMDLEVVHAIAPQAKLVVYNFSNDLISAAGINHLNGVVSASRGDIISESLALCEQYATSLGARDFQAAYARADVAGEAVFASSGDDAAYGCINGNDTSPPPSAIAAMLPEVCPGVTAVGGTRISVRKNGDWFNETVWEDPLETEGTGGGVSHYFSRPSWQAAPGVSTQDSRYGSAGKRLVPDVAADADPASGMEIDYPSGWGLGGGTSQAAPIWAGITAVIDQYLEANHHHAVGWMNPALYALARTPQAFPPYHDVVVGTNLHYAAGPGYDMTTGLGTPDAWFLAQDLANYQAGNGQ